MVDPYISGKLSVSSFGKYIHWFTFSAKAPSFLETPAKTPEFGTIIQNILLFWISGERKKFSERKKKRRHIDFFLKHTHTHHHFENANIILYKI